MFRGCKMLKVDNILVEGVTSIGTKAFYGNETTKSITLPSTLRDIAVTAFDNNKNLEEVHIKSEIFTMIKYGRSSNTELFNSSRQIICYLPKYCTIQDDYFAANVKVVRLEASEEDKLVERKIQKGSMLGATLDNTKLIRKGSELAEVLLSVKQEELTNAILDMINKMVKSGRYYGEGTYVLSGFKVNLRLDSDNLVKKAQKIKVINKYIVLICKNWLIFYPTDKVLLNEYFKTKRYNTTMIECSVISSKYLKSADVGEDGTIRLIYQHNGQNRVELLDKFSISRR
jgi:hypothetical protein